MRRSNICTKCFFQYEQLSKIDLLFLSFDKIRAKTGLRRKRRLRKVEDLKLTKTDGFG